MSTSLHRTFSLAAVFLIAVGLTGCDSFTENADPKGTLTQDQLAGDPDGVEALAVSAYSALDANLPDPNPAFLNPPSNWSLSDVRSDDAYKGGGGTGDLTEIHLMEINNGLEPTNPIANRKWRAVFVGIQRANDALSALKDISEEEFPEKQTRIAEMRFLRGHYYFDLKKIFNRVPWIDETATTAEARNISNTELSSSELWDKIEADFQFAADNLPPTPPEPGRADQLAAHGYLAKVALFREQWEEVIQHTNEVINSDQFGLLDSYRDLSRVDQFDNGKEDVFSIQYSVNDGSAFGNINWGDLLNMPTTDACGGGGDGFLRPSQNLVNAYKVNSDGLPMFDTFNDTDLNPRDTTTPVDPRLDFVVTRLGIPWKGFSQVPDEGWMRQLEVYGPYARKKLIVPPDSPYQVEGFPWCASSLNWPLIRYAEVLLWKAEALVESNQNLDQARQLVNRIRQRAANQDSWYRTQDDSEFAANYQIGTYPTDVWTQDFAREAVRFETRLETALEGHRFFNLVRWGNVSEVMQDYYAGEVDDSDYLQNATFQSSKHEYMPIPQAQIDISEGLYEQNPGY